MNHLTVDLETLGTEPTSVITAIGAVFFDLEGETKEFYTTVDAQSCLDAGLTVNGDTIMWWMQQSNAARQALKSKYPATLETALSMYGSFVANNRTKNLCVWTHATFDAPILDYAFKIVDVKNPVHYKENRDIRTLTYLNNLNRDKSKKDTVSSLNDGFIAHNALDDARKQAIYIARMLNSFRERLAHVEGT